MAFRRKLEEQDMMMATAAGPPPVQDDATPIVDEEPVGLVSSIIFRIANGVTGRSDEFVDDTQKLEDMCELGIIEAEKLESDVVRLRSELDDAKADFAELEGDLQVSLKRSANHRNRVVYLEQLNEQLQQRIDRLQKSLDDVVCGTAEGDLLNSSTGTHASAARLTPKTSLLQTTSSGQRPRQTRERQDRDRSQRYKRKVDELLVDLSRRHGEHTAAIITELQRNLESALRDAENAKRANHKLEKENERLELKCRSLEAANRRRDEQARAQAVARDDGQKLREQIKRLESQLQAACKEKVKQRRHMSEERKHQMWDRLARELSRGHSMTGSSRSAGLGQTTTLPSV